MLQQSFKCECNPSKLYASKSTFNKHFTSKRHKDWESTDELRDMKIQLTRAQNEIIGLRTEIDRLTNLLMNPHKRKVSAVVKKKVAADAHWSCTKCSKIVDCMYEVDHIQPLAMGGTNDFHNLQLLCQQCHKNKTRQENTEFNMV
ncbi:hypothetical protein EhVM1_000117 [Emiliania huxleyi virus M1]|nr:hypothetical protein EhVM1_000117 [Emiliania huxleyi virus M1]|mmetsp:Transcript_22837/g.65239  ORF Transcript_22837/g.65239 Transcript_22837/m.65239 type:complete len:145 (-) Transcript_22837:32-466(-)